MAYRGFKAQIDFDDEAGRFVGQVINTHEPIIFHGQSVDELRQAFHAAVEGHLAAGGEPQGQPQRRPGRGLRLTDSVAV